MMKLRIAVLFGGLLSSVAVAQDWGKPEPVAIPDSPVNIHLAGWGKAALKQVTLVRGTTNDQRGDQEVYIANASANGYEAQIIVREAFQTIAWQQDTIQNIATRTFAKQTIDLGSYFDIDYGAADFRAIPLSFTEQGIKVNCAVFRAYWRNFFANGFLCAPGKELSNDAVKSFVSHIRYKNALVPKDEGTLP